MDWKFPWGRLPAVTNTAGGQTVRGQPSVWGGAGGQAAGHPGWAPAHTGGTAEGAACSPAGGRPCGQASCAPVPGRCARDSGTREGRPEKGLQARGGARRVSQCLAHGVTSPPAGRHGAFHSRARGEKACQLRGPFSPRSVCLPCECVRRGAGNHPRPPLLVRDKWWQPRAAFGVANESAGTNVTARPTRSSLPAGVPAFSKRLSPGHRFHVQLRV